MKQLKIHPKVDALKRWQVVIINIVMWIVALALLAWAITVRTK